MLNHTTEKAYCIFGLMTRETPDKIPEVVSGKVLELRTHVHDDWYAHDSYIYWDLFTRIQEAVEGETDTEAEFISTLFQIVQFVVQAPIIRHDLAMISNIDSTDYVIIFGMNNVLYCLGANADNACSIFSDEATS